MQSDWTEGIVEEFRSVVERFRSQAQEWIQQGSAGGLEAWEEHVRDWVQPLQRQMLEGLLGMIGKGYQGPRIRCANCQAEARYVGDRPHRLQTVVGRLEESRRAYYHGCLCEGGLFPQDEKLGLDDWGRSPGFRRLVSLAGAASSYEKATDYLWEMGRIPTSRTTVERVTEAEGERAEAFLRAREAHGDANLALTGDPAERIYVETDGTTAPTRQGWKEVKLGCVFEQKGLERTKAHYTAGFEAVEEFLPRLRGLAKARGTRDAREVVVLADGATWIWNRVPELLGRPVTEIVDWYHAKERLFRIAALAFGETSPEGQAWARQRERELWRGRPERVVEGLKALRSRRKDARTLARQSIGYFGDNAERMRYDRFRKKGYYIGSGVIESGCKQVVGERLKQAGMRWNRTHAEKILALRVCRASGLWDRFWDAQRQAAA